MTEEDIKLLAELIAGLQVPRSLPLVLGVAVEPYDKFRTKYGLFGWQSAEEIERIMKEYYRKGA